LTGSLTPNSIGTAGGGGGDVNDLSGVACPQPTLIRVNPEGRASRNGLTTIRIASEANRGWREDGSVADKCLRATGKDDMGQKQPVRKGTLR
jgi:hypothetical protein